MNILVLGWYNAGNLGDELFKEAFTDLFPALTFRFVNAIMSNDLEWAEAVFIGGGSFLHGKPNVSDDNMLTLSSKKIFYIGIGVESEIHPYHLSLMKNAKLIAIRTPHKLNEVKKINKNTICVPDLVYALEHAVYSAPKKEKSVLIIPNIEVVPKHNDAQWKHSSWLHFKSEFSQFLDVLIENKYTVKFLSMCENPSLSDRGTAHEIINMMAKRKYQNVLGRPDPSIKDISLMLSNYETIITQRFHGHVLAEMVGRPCLTIHHHDKLKVENSISYYGSYKQLLLEKFDELQYKKVYLKDNKKLFVNLTEKINALLQ